MRKPVGVTSIPNGNVVVVCDDGSVWANDTHGNWLAYKPIPETHAAGGDRGQAHLNALRAQSSTADVVNKKY